ncbi:MAG TPA: cbb3-type cytochrome c oxidase subunit II, partial [Elusimicrobiota bacterium]|nr:cbb3-type cytochrome c oxidase subunit II [Elusimicrobiota bacterium]
GKYDNTWHFNHFKNPPALVEGSIMPSYAWFFDKEGNPNAKGLAIVTYVQWLGTWPRVKGLDEEW